MGDFLAFAVVGFLAQIVDGALGMGFGVISASVLLAQGIPPSLVSASVNAAKLPTTGTAALSHYFHRNIDWSLVRPIAFYGAIGGVAGSLLLTSLKGHALSSLVNLYLILIGTLIVYRGITSAPPRLIAAKFARLIGLSGGLIEGIGGSWGPVVTTSLMGAGTESRYAIGSTNFAEFVVSIAVFTSFVTLFLLGYWQGGSDWRTTFYPVLGLVIGGLPAAIMGGYLSKHAPRRILTVAVGCFALGIAAYRMMYV